METKQYMVGDVITMRLMRREKGAVVAMPSSQWVKVEEPVRFGGKLAQTWLWFSMCLLLWCTLLTKLLVCRQIHDTIFVGWCAHNCWENKNQETRCHSTSVYFSSPDTSLSPYSKLLLTSSTQVLSLVEDEKAVLQAQLCQEEEGQACFIQSALCHLQVKVCVHVLVFLLWQCHIFFQKIKLALRMITWVLLMGNADNQVINYSKMFNIGQFLFRNPVWCQCYIEQNKATWRSCCQNGGVMPSLRHWCTLTSLIRCGFQDWKRSNSINSTSASCSEVVQSVLYQFLQQKSLRIFFKPIKHWCIQYLSSLFNSSQEWAQQTHS